MHNVLAWLKKSSWTLPLLLLAAVLAPRLYMNIRPSDPLPSRFERYTAEVFAQAQAAGGPILVDVYASWCPTCKAQHQTLRNLLDDPAFRTVRGFRVDFDEDTEFLRQYRIPTQSTILMFDGERLVSRTVGLTREADVRAQVIEAITP